jgi:hypothetical protein
MWLWKAAPQSTCPRWPLYVNLPERVASYPNLGLEPLNRTLKEQETELLKVAAATIEAYL